MENKAGPELRFPKCEDEGTLHLTKIPDGTYWLRVEDSRHAAHGVDTLFVYTGKKSITLEL